MRALLVGIVLGGALAGWLWAGLGHRAARVTSGFPPRVVRSFRLPPLVGNEPVVYEATARGPDASSIVLVFFASWCPPCRVELPVVAKTWERVAASRLAVRFIGVDVNDEPGPARMLVAASGVRFPVAADESAAFAGGVLGVPGLPVTLFVAPGGRVVGDVRGPLAVSVLDRWINRLAVLGARARGLGG
jgi:thiol-disulfide isomerase/thioredoxin